MGWVFLAVAIAGDLAGTAALERGSRGRYVRHLALAATAYLIAFFAFSRALLTVPTSIADSIYFAGATALVTAYSALWLGERLTYRKATALALIGAGVVVLRLQAT
jgi:small multidrug resistance pump